MEDVANYWKRAMASRLSRRRILKAGAGAGLGLAALTLVGCPEQQGKVTTSETPQGRAEGSPTPAKPTGSLKIGTGVPDKMDPTISTSPSHSGVPSAVFDSLVELTPEGQMRPGIAERWEIASDGLTHTFYIRKGVKFHDGSDLTGADVKFSVERVLAPATTHTDANGWRAAIAGVDLKDDYTVALRMKQPQFELLTGFTYLSGLPSVLPKKYIEEKGEDYFRRNPVGSGPFKVVSWQPGGTRMDLEAMESHWRAVPRFQKITALNVTEEATRVAMLKTGELDMASISTDSVSALKAAGLRMLGHDGGTQAIGYLFRDMDNPGKYAIGDVRVRKALSLAVNRQEIADKLLGGYAQPAAVGFALPTAYFWDANTLKPDPYDPEGAKKLLAEAGYPSGFQIKLWDTGGSGTSIVQAIAGYWEKVGVTPEIVAIAGSTLVSMFVPKQVPEIWNSLMFLAPSFPAEGRLALYHSTKGTVKVVRNVRLDEIIDKLPATLDLAEKKKLGLEAAVLAKNEHGVVPIVNQQVIFALSAKIGGITFTKSIAGVGPALETITPAK